MSHNPVFSIKKHCGDPCLSHHTSYRAFCIVGCGTQKVSAAAKEPPFALCSVNTKPVTSRYNAEIRREVGMRLVGSGRCQTFIFKISVWIFFDNPCFQASYFPIFFHNHRKFRFKVFIMILAVFYGLTEDIVLYVFCDFQLKLVPNCVAFGCTINACYHQYWITHRMVSK